MPVRGYDRCLFFGDSFTNGSFEKYFQARKSVEYNGYVKANFDVSGYFGSSFLTDNPSLLSRLSNLLTQAFSCTFSGKLLPPPKLIIMVLDNDIIKLFNSDGVTSEDQCISKQFSSFELCNDRV